jgi:hypothetical protein
MNQILRFEACFDLSALGTIGNFPSTTGLTHEKVQQWLNFLLEVNSSLLEASMLKISEAWTLVGFQGRIQMRNMFGRLEKVNQNKAAQLNFDIFIEFMKKLLLCAAAHSGFHSLERDASTFVTGTLVEELQLMKR